MEGEQVIDKAIKIAKVLVMEAIISVAALCLFALILMRFQPSESGIRMGVRILYIIVNLIGGFLIGKIMKQKKFLWGVITGLIYFVIISIISCLVTQSFYSDIQNAITICLLCVAGGMAGGMLS